MSSKPVHPLDQPPTPAHHPPERSPIKRVEISQVVPFFSYFILAINVIVFLIDLLSGRWLTALGAKDNFLIVQGQLWRLFTPMFLHGGFVHLGVN
ncbi:MAG: rhomboid family intramembrane serine protease, partial [Anaerolineae bacterium]|nr:rhomboid family intramembrane serine protease [Anaerolineae bacterium]